MINLNVNNGLRSVTTTEPSTPTKSPVAVVDARPGKAANTEASTVTPPQQDVPSAEELTVAVSKLNDFVQNVQRTLAFSVEEDTGITVVRVFDSETEELIRQIPAEETIKLAASIEGQIASLFLKEQA